MQKTTITIKSRFALAFGSITLLNLIVAGLAARSGLNDIRACLPLCAVALLSACVSVWGLVHFRRVICGGLDRQRRKFDELAATLDLSGRSASPRRDEFGASASAFDRLMRRVEDAVRSVDRSADMLSGAVHQIAAGNVDLSARTEGQAASLEQAAASMLELTDTVKQNAEHTRNALALSRDATTHVEAGVEATEQMVATIQRIDQNAIKISEVTGVIEGIAFQTNLLALNAAVEAARAGEQGKSFAVVANEVGLLAQRSTTASREIKALIQSSASTAQLGRTQAVGVGQTMAHLQQVIGVVSGAFSKVEQASSEQRLSIEQINQAVRSMDAVTQQNAALVEEIAAAAQLLEGQTVELKREVGTFRF